MLAFACNMHHIAGMAQIRTKGSGGSTRRTSGAKPQKSPRKVAITVRLDAARAQQLEVVAEAENRSLTNYVETALIRDLTLRDEAARVITVLAAPGTSERISPDAIMRGDGETDTAYAKRQELLTELWSVPDSP
jgi:hypothetical protein